MPKVPATNQLSNSAKIANPPIQPPPPSTVSSHRPGKGTDGLLPLLGNPPKKANRRIVVVQAIGANPPNLNLTHSATRPLPDPAFFQLPALTLAVPPDGVGAQGHLKKTL